MTSKGRTTAPEPTPIKRPRWRLRLALWIYPWWTQDGVDAVKWRAHVKRRELGFVRCVEVDQDDW